MSWLGDIFKNPKLGYSPSLEPPGWNLLRDLMMRKIFNLQASPYGYDPSQGQSMQSLLPTGGRGTFNPYSGGYGGGAGDAGGGGGLVGGGMGGGMGGPSPRVKYEDQGEQKPPMVLGRDRMPVVPPGPAGGGMGNPTPGGSSPMRPGQQAQQQSGQASSGGFQGGRRGDNGTQKPKANPPEWWEPGGQISGPVPFPEPSENPFKDFNPFPIGGAERPPDANPDIAPPQFQGPADPRKHDWGAWSTPPPGWDRGVNRDNASFDGRRLGYDSPYMFQRGPLMLGSDGPTLSTNTPVPGRRRNIFREQQQNYFGGNPADILRRMGFNFQQGPQAGTMFNKGGQSYFNQGASHEGAGPGGQSQFLQGLGYGQGSKGRYGGDIPMIDRMMAAVAQNNLNQRVRSITPQEKAQMGATGRDIFGGSAMGVPGGAHGTPGTGVDWRQKPVQAAPKTEGPGEVKPPRPQTPKVEPPGEVKPPQAPVVTGSQLPTTGTVKLKDEEKPLGTDGGFNDPTGRFQSFNSGGGPSPTGADQGGVLAMLMEMLSTGGGGGGGTGQGSMPMMDPRLQRRRPPGF